jgi:hypothetical protein
MATNRIDTLDPALIRPGRIDRKIEFPLPDIKTKRRIFHIHTSRMTLADDVDVEEIVTTKDDLSGADVKVWAPLRPLVQGLGVRKISDSVFFMAPSWSLGGVCTTRRCARRPGCWPCASGA